MSKHSEKGLYCTESSSTASLPHGNEANKSQHNFIFASWLVSEFGQNFLREGSCIDIAGGNGGISFELSVRYGIESVLVDIRSGVKLNSMQRRRMKRLCKKRKKSSTSDDIERDPLILLLKNHYGDFLTSDDGYILERVTSSIQDSSSLPFRHVPKSFPLFFNADACDQELLVLLESAQMLIGMHADQATESIVDAALQLNLSFAVVPCCVFPNLFPERRNSDGSLVTSTEEFIEYLLRKDVSIQKHSLPFMGRNVVLFRLVSSATDSIAIHSDNLINSAANDVLDSNEAL